MILLVVWRTSIAQRLPAAFDNLFFHHLNANSNIKLKNPVLNLGFMAQDGMLYLGGESGLYQFNGSSIQSFLHDPKNSKSICENYITNIIEDKNHNFWIGTQNGISYFNRNTKEFTNYQKLKSDVPIPPNFYTYPFYIDQDEKIWVYISGSIFKLDPNTRTLAHVTNFSNGRLYVNQPFYKNSFHVIGNKYSGFSELKIKDGKIIFKASYANKFNDSIKCIIKRTWWHNDTTVYMATNNGLLEFFTTNKKINLYRSFPQPQQNDFASISGLKNNKDMLLLGTTTNGLLIFHLPTKRFISHYTHDPLDPNSISGNNIQDIVCDADNNIFLVIPNVGISYCNTLQIQFNKQLLKKEILPYNFLDNKIQTIVATNQIGKIMIGTANNGLLIYDWLVKKIAKHINIPEGIKQIIALNEGNYLAVGNSNAVYKIYKSNYNYTFKKLIFKWSNIETPEIIIQDVNYHHKKLLFATNYGLAEVSIGSNDYSLIYEQALSAKVHWNNFANIIPLDTTFLLVQALSTNLYLVAATDSGYQPIKEIARTPYQILSSCTFQDKIALGTSIGLKYYDIKNKTITNDKYISDYCVGIIFHSNNLWLTTKNGLIQYQPENGARIKYLQENGLQDNVFNTRSLIAVSNSILAGGMNGFNVFRPQNIQNTVYNYSGIINKLWVQNKEISFKKYINNPNQPLNLSYKDDHISLDIAPLVYTNNSEANVYVQLEGVDPERIGLKGANTVTYSNLQPGQYLLRVSGSKDYNSSILYINILAPFWETWWFYTLISILSLAVIIGLIKLYQYINNNKQIKDLRIMISSQERERERIARDLHDLFGARLSTLKLYMQTMNKNNANSVKTLTSSATNMIDNAISELRHLLFDLSPKTLTENGLISAVEDLVHNIEQITKIEIHTDFITYDQYLIHKKELSIYRIVQELLNNTLKYAQATVIHISIVKNGSDIIFLYEDNGIGFDQSKIDYGYGLNNIKLHTKAMLGELVIESSEGKGMQVIITIPYKE